MSSKWTREYGVDSEGRKAILITERAEERPYVSVFTKFQFFCLKVVIGMFVFLVIPLLFLGRFFAG